MKKIINTLFAVAIALAATVSLTACGSDDEPENPAPPTFKQVSLITKFYVNQGMLDAYDIVATDAAGRSVAVSTTTEKVLVGFDEMNLYYYAVETTSTSLPASSTLNLKFALKDGYDASQSEFAYGEDVKAIVTYSDGSKGYYESGVPAHMTIKKEYLSKFTETLNGRYGSIEATFNGEKISVDKGAQK